MSGPLDFTFGIELECLLECSESTLLHLNNGNPPIYPDEKDDIVFAAVFKELVRGGISCIDPHNRDEGEGRYSRWDLQQDESIQGDSPDDSYRGSVHRIPMEIVSRILRPGAQAASEIEKVLSLIQNRFKMAVSSRTGFHVHVGCASGPMPLETIKKFAILVLTFGGLLNSIHPTRKGNSFCASVHSAVQTGPLLRVRPEDRAKVIYSCKTITDLVKLMNPGGRRNYAYNFTNLATVYVPIGAEIIALTHTIEFRQHAGTVDPMEIPNWVRVTTGLVKYAHRASLSMLRDVISKGGNSSFKILDLFKIIGIDDVIQYYQSRV